MRFRHIAAAAALLLGTVFAEAQILPTPPSPNNPPVPNIPVTTGCVVVDAAGDVVCPAGLTVVGALVATGGFTPGAITGTTIDNSPIGQTTPAAGKFTGLQATGTVFGVGFTNLFASPPAIGGTAANTGKFTALTSTGALLLTGGSSGSTPAAGNIGETVSASLASGSAITLTSATPANVTSISLTAGNWACDGNEAQTTGGSSAGFVQAALSTTSATLPTLPAAANEISAAFSVAVNMSLPTGTLHISSGGATTVFLVAQQTFTGTSGKAWGILTCVRQP